MAAHDPRRHDDAVLLVLLGQGEATAAPPWLPGLHRPLLLEGGVARGRLVILRLAASGGLTHVAQDQYGGPGRATVREVGRTTLRVSGQPAACPAGLDLVGGAGSSGIDAAVAI